MNYEINLDLAGAFLKALEPGGLFTFQTFDDSESRKMRIDHLEKQLAALRNSDKDADLPEPERAELDGLLATKRSLTRVIHGRDILDVTPALLDLNLRGAGIFVTINRTNGNGRKASDVIALRAIFVDADGIPRPSRWHADPNLVVWRDEIHWHAYWLLPDSVPLAEFTPLQKRLIQFYCTDAAVHDLSRVMRLPGFLHRKHDPVLVHFEEFQHANA